MFVNGLRTLPPDDIAMWVDKKRKSVALAEAYGQLGKQYKTLSENIRLCAPAIERLGYPSASGEGLDVKTLFAGTCKGRLCPLCGTLRGRRLFVRVVPRFEARLAENHGIRAAFATFTVPNVPMEQGRTAGAQIIAGFRRMTQRKAFKKAVLGWMRALEVSYNSKTNMLHPHLHVVLLLHRNYFSKAHDLYLSQPEWLKLWRDVMRNEAIEIFDIRRLRPRVKTETLASALGEVCKYPMKPLDVFIRDGDRYRVDPHVLAALHRALKGRRLTGFGGLLRSPARVVDEECDPPSDWMLTDEEIEELLKPEVPEPFFVEQYHWNGRDYVEPEPTIQTEDC